MSRIVSIDYGLKRIGLAISDERNIIATSLGIVLAQKSSKLTIQELHKTLKPYQLSKIIVGNPVHMSGKPGFLADEVRHFVSLLKEVFSCEIVLWDERLSSVQAERSLIEGGMNRKKRTSYVDSVAAMILLQSYLEYLSINKERSETSLL